MYAFSLRGVVHVFSLRGVAHVFRIRDMTHSFRKMNKKGVCHVTDMSVSCHFLLIFHVT